MFKSEIYTNASDRLQVNFNLVHKGNSSLCQIWLTATVQKVRVRIYTGLRIDPLFWQKRNGRMIGERALEDGDFSDVQKRVNKGINKELKRILDYCQEFMDVTSASDLREKSIPFTAASFKNFMSAKITGQEATIRKNAEEFIKDYIDRKASMVNKQTNRTLCSGTLYNHKNALRRLQKYCNEKRKKIVWELFNRRFEADFTAWMNCHGYSANTIASQYSIMKVWLYDAEIEGYVVDKIFHRYQTKVHDVDNIFLTEEEIKRLYDIDFSDETIREQIDPKSNIEQTRDLFIVACWTGLRFGDWSDLSHAQISGNRIKLRTHKTMQEVVIPIHPMVKNILEKYGGQLPHSVAKDKAIKHIQLCGKLAHINEPTVMYGIKGGEETRKEKPKYKYITNHTARRSFCTNMFLSKVPTRAIMAISGHTTEENFRKYIKVDKNQYADMIEEVFKKAY